jgi:SAM-dependent methyltransferase
LIIEKGGKTLPKECTEPDSEQGKVEEYFIKPGYHSGAAPGQQVMYEGQQNSIEDSSTWQYEVYECASRIIRKYKLTSILDIGCGCGMKLKKLILPASQDITGIDEASTIAWCKQNHDFGTWYDDNLEDPKLDLGRTFDLIISADVIEHLVNPDKLLDVIKRFSSKDSYIILSTPERDATRGKDDMGPPQYHLHAREWNFNEFRKYIEHQGFRVIKHFRAEPMTPLQLQNGRLRGLRQRIRAFLYALSEGRRFVSSGQILLLKRQS